MNNLPRSKKLKKLVYGTMLLCFISIAAVVAVSKQSPAESATSAQQSVLAVDKK